MGKRESRIEAERKNGFGASSTAKKTKRASQPKKAGSTSGNPSPQVNGYGERTSRYITSGTYERAVKRKQRDINSWFGRGM